MDGSPGTTRALPPDFWSSVLTLGSQTVAQQKHSCSTHLLKPPCGRGTATLQARSQLFPWLGKLRLGDPLRGAQPQGQQMSGRLEPLPSATLCQCQVQRQENQVTPQETHARELSWPLFARKKTQSTSKPHKRPLLHGVLGYVRIPGCWGLGAQGRGELAVPSSRDPGSRCPDAELAAGSFPRQRLPGGR